MLIMAICAPYLFTFFDSIFRALFGKKPWPTLKVLVLVLLVETAHSFGICLFAFRVLPKLDLARAILIMNAVCIVPGMFKLLLAKNNASTFKKMLIFIMDLLAVLMQCTVFGIVFASKFVFKSQTSTSPIGLGDNSNPMVDAGGASLPDDIAGFTMPADQMTDTAERMKRQLVRAVLNQTMAYLNVKNASFFKSRSLLSNDYDLFADGQQVVDNGQEEMSTMYAIDDSNVGGSTNKANGNGNNIISGLNLEEILFSFQIEWELPIALMLVSLVWWENFIDRDLKFGSFKLIDVKLLKENLTATRCKTNFISSLWKVMVTLFFAYLFHPRIFNTGKVFHTPDLDADGQFKFNEGGMMGNTAFGAWNGGGGSLPGPPPAPMDEETLQRRRRSLNETFLSTLAVVVSASTTPNYHHERQQAFEQQHSPQRQMFDNGFTQMLIPSFSTIPNVFNVNKQNGQNFEK